MASLITGIGGVFGGVAATTRARGQNKTDVHTGLTAEQATFRADMFRELERLTARNQYLSDKIDKIDQRNDELIKINADSAAKLTISDARLESYAEQLTTAIRERSDLIARVARLETEADAAKKEITRMAQNLDTCTDLIDVLRASKQAVSDMKLVITDATETVGAVQQNTDELRSNTSALDANTEAQHAE